VGATPPTLHAYRRRGRSPDLRTHEIRGATTVGAGLARHGSFAGKASCGASPASTYSIQLHHLEIVLGRAAIRAGPRIRHVGPTRTRRDTLFGQAVGLAVDEAADDAHPG